MSEKGVSFVDHDEILTYEEMLHIVTLCVKKGICKVRVTGGEPFVRRGILSFLERLGRIQGVDEISLTTNGIKLKSFARHIRRFGICRINVSMDTLKPERFYRITRRDLFKQVWEGINEAAAVGLHPLKINVVVIKGINDDEILDFARLTYEKPFHIRFIEKMPVGSSNTETLQTFLSTAEIISKISILGTLRPLNNGCLDGPARRFALKGAAGEIGFIGALSHEFCGTCNRLRLTADGQLRGCLFSDQQTDLKTPLRQGRCDEDLLKLITNTIVNKPVRHALRNGYPRKCVRTMNSIGG
jgi:cyclic pyranopterin phosphate synthase